MGYLFFAEFCQILDFFHFCYDCWSAQHRAVPCRVITQSKQKQKQTKFIRANYLPAIGVLSIEELEGVRPLPLTGVEVFLGVEEPKPTGVCL